MAGTGDKKQNSGGIGAAIGTALWEGAKGVGRLVRGVIAAPLLVGAMAVAAVGYAVGGIFIGGLTALSALSSGYVGSSDFDTSASHKEVPKEEGILDALWRYTKEGCTLGIVKFDPKPGSGTEVVQAVGRTVGYTVAGAAVGVGITIATGGLGAVAIPALAVGGAVIGTVQSVNEMSEMTQARAEQAPIERTPPKEPTRPSHTDDAPTRSVVQQRQVAKEKGARIVTSKDCTELSKNKDLQAIAKEYSKQHVKSSADPKPVAIQGGQSVRLPFSNPHDKTAFLSKLAAEGKQFLAKDRSGNFFYSDGNKLHTFKSHQERAHFIQENVHEHTAQQSSPRADDVTVDSTQPSPPQEEQAATSRATM